MEVVDLYIGIGFDWIDWIDGRFLGNLLWRCCWSFRGWVWVGLVGVGIGLGSIGLGSIGVRVDRRM